MIKLGVNTVLFQGFDLETAMKSIAEAGYDGVELSAIKGMCEHLRLEDYRSQVDDIRGLAERFDLDLLAMEVASLDEERLSPAFEAAVELGIPVVNVGPGGDDLERQIGLLASRSEQAAAHGVHLCVKAHVGQCIHDTPTTLEAMKQIDSPGFGVDMDPSHIYRAAGGENPVVALQAVIPRLRHVHIRDCDRALRATEGPPGPPEAQACGRGDIDLFGYVRVLHEAAIDIAVDLEVIGAGDRDLAQVVTIAAESRGYLNACLRAAAVGSGNAG